LYTGVEIKMWAEFLLPRNVVRQLDLFVLGEWQ